MCIYYMCMHVYFRESYKIIFPHSFFQIPFDHIVTDQWRVIMWKFTEPPLEGELTKSWA